MSQDNGFDRKDSGPLYAGRVAAPGEFTKRVEKSPFHSSNLLKTAAFYIESGRFAEGSDVIQAELAKRKVEFEYLPKGTYKRGTRVEGDHEFMQLDDNFKDHPPAQRLWELLHRNMSLILQRSGKREDTGFMRQLLELDIAYAEAVRLGATRIKDVAEKDSAEHIATEIEIRTKLNLTSFPPEEQLPKPSADRSIASRIKGIGRRIMRAGK